MNKLTDIGKVIATLKIDNNEKISDLAKNLGIQPSYVSAIMYGRIKVSFKIGQRIFNSYHLNDEEIKILISEIFNKNVVSYCEKFGFNIKEFGIALFKV